MLIQLRDGSWINPLTVTGISALPNGNKIMDGHLVNIYMKEDRQYTIWFPPAEDAQVLAEAYRDNLAAIINHHQEH